MRFLIITLPLILAGCSSESRTSWEQCPQHRHLIGITVPADPAQPGTVRMVYPDAKPVQDFGTLGHPESVSVSYEQGIHVNAYDAQGMLVSHRWQQSIPLHP